MVLERYNSILEGKALPAFMKSKSIEADFSDESEAQLFKLHNSLLQKLDSVKEYSPKKKSLLELKIHLARKILSHCELCERKCKVNREKEKGFCGVGLNSRIASMFRHMGEESALVPSGTIFFTGCTFRCVFCQNWDISQFPGHGAEKSPGEVASWLEDSEVTNANFVGGEPTPNLWFILRVMKHLEKPLPMIWNSNMYMSEKCMDLLNGVIDLYLSDFKYGNDKCAAKLSSAPNYVKIVKRNHLLAEKHADLLIRHLVLPNHIECCTYKVLEIIKPMHALVNVMAQYRPEYKAHKYPEIARPLTREEYQKAAQKAKELRLTAIIQRI